MTNYRPQESAESFSAENPPPLLPMKSGPSRPVLTREERELVKPRLSAHLSQNPYYKQRIAKEGDAFLESWINAMPCNRGLLNL